MSLKFEKLLYETDTEGVRRLQQRLWKRMPYSVQMLALLKLASDRRFPSEVDVQFFILNDSLSEDNTNDDDNCEDNPFIVCIQRPNFHSKKAILLLTPVDPTPSQITAFDTFLTTHEDGWTVPMTFCCTQRPIWQVLINLCKSHGVMLNSDTEGIPGLFLAIPDLSFAKSLEVEVNDLSTDDHPNVNVTVRPLEKDDVPLVVEQWKWAAAHSEDAMLMCVGTLMSCGVFDKGEMASSVLQSPLGVFNCLYTPEKFRRRGLGKWVMKWVSKRIAEEMGVFPMAEIEVWNDASKSVLKSVGYEEMYLTKWFYYEPKN